MTTLKPSRLPKNTTDLVLRTVTRREEIKTLRLALRRGHYLGDGRAAGHTLWQAIYRHDPESGTHTLVAVFCWAGAAWALRERDRWIDWDNVTRANRLKLIVQLRRFLIIEDQRHPNLASQCLGLGLRTLQDEWEKQHQYRPLLAESFHDPAHHTGTLYKATNWTPLGFTKGFKRHRRDFYLDARSPKHLWIRPLQKNARALLARPGQLPEVQQKAIAQATAGARSALSSAQLRSLRAAFKDIDDFRNPKSRRYPLSAMLGLIAYGLICGAPDVKSIWRKCGPLNQQQRAAIGLNQREKKSGRLKLPGYDALNNFLNALDPAVLGSALNTWLQSNSDLLPKSLALDGKNLGNGSGDTLSAIVTLCHHHNGQPLAQRTYSGKKNDCELPVSQSLLEHDTPDLSNSTITGDPLNAQKKRHSSPTKKERTASLA